MAFDKPDIVVVGAGGMGALFGAILQDGGLTVTLVDSNKEHVNTISNKGLFIEGYGGDRTVSVPAQIDTTSINQADVILFQCKAHGTRDGARSIRHLVDNGAVCISFQNGLGNEEVIAEEVGPENVLGGLTAMAGYMWSPGHIQDFSRVPSYIGEMHGGLTERAEQIADAFTRAGLETHASTNIRQDIWKKLLGNVAMSAASGITNLTSATCLQIPTLRETSIRALDEALAVAASQGIELSREAAIEGMEFISQPGGTGDNKSSLCVDILNQRPSEVEYIYGTVIALAKEAGVPTPTLDTLASLVRGIESHYVEQ